jgi:spermidine synthase
MKHWYIYLAVTVSGASVLGIEILGTRIIGPFYGVSLYLWSALIGVTLAALSVGYAIGGRWADRSARISRFCLLLALAGVWICTIPWLRHPILTVTEPLGLRAAVLITATALFFPPLMLLGMVSPYAIRLKVSKIEFVGRTAGNLYAVSTAASVVAAIATGFYLIPSVGVSRLTFLIGSLLIITAIVGAVGRGSRATTIFILLLVPLIGGAALQLAPGNRPNADSGVLVLENSPYAEIRVVDREGLRYMIIDGGTHTIVDPETWISYFPYVDVLDLVKGILDEPGDMLLVGLGGGSVAKSFGRDGWHVDAVEIDPTVVRLATSYFGLESREADIFQMDGRQYLITNETQYDLVVLDAFGSSSIPFHLVTREAFELAKHRMRPGGILAMNVEAVGWHDVLVHTLAATLATQFQHVTVLPMAEPPNQIGNVVILASERVIELREDLPVPESRFSQEYNRVHAWDNRFEVDAAGIRVLTDDLNPVDIWSERINLVARKDLHEFFGSEGTSW